MEQLSFNLSDELDDIYCEFEQEYDDRIICFLMKADLKKKKLNYTETKRNIKDWFAKRFFTYDLEISCEDLYNIAVKNGVKLI